MKPKTDLNQIYFPDAELKDNPKPYIDYCKVLKRGFGKEWPKLKTFCDVGCRQGYLLYEMCAYKSVRGIEYFSWMKQSAPSDIRVNIILADLRDQLDIGSFDLVNCSEVGEHIDPDYCGVFLNNLKKMTGKYLVMTWSCSGGIKDLANDPNCQHLNPLSFDKFVSLMEGSGFILNKNLTTRLRHKCLFKIHFYPWWKKSITVWNNGQVFRTSAAEAASAR